MMIFSGGCQCGNIRYSISSKPTTAYCCHCTDCQQQSSSAFGMSVWFPASKFELLSGKLSTWKTQSASGNEKMCNFCPECGTRIYHGNSDQSETFSVKGGSLDSIRDIAPVAHIWTSSAQPWIRQRLSNEHCYKTEPDSFDMLVDLYQRAPARLG